MARGSDLYDADFLGETPQRTKVRTRHQKRMLQKAQARGPPRFAHVALEADVLLEAPLFETEDRANVEAAFLALFPDAQFDAGAPPSAVRARARDLAPFAEVLRKTRIRDTARQVLKDAVGADRVVRFKLNKQAAAAAHANFVAAEGVLGAISVEVRVGEPEHLAEELTWIEGESDERLFGTKFHTLPPRHRRQP